MLIHSASVVLALAQNKPTNQSIDGVQVSRWPFLEHAESFACRVQHRFGSEVTSAVLWVNDNAHENRKKSNRSRDKRGLGTKSIQSQCDPNLIWKIAFLRMTAIIS
eukprot:m.121729 g.121729  ORF g.121729 m.121729 type:complete len:106 (-) comp13395_c0_seq1:52-369(-)